jgi:hypothetical protein
MRGGAQPLSLNLPNFLPNADEIVGKSWKIKKTIDNSFNGGIIASTQE